MKKFRTINAVLNSPLANVVAPSKINTTDRVLRSTKLEDSIYTDLRADDGSLDQVEQTAAEKLASFPALSRDVFQSFYSLLPRHNDESTLSVAARKFNAPILEHITQSEDFPTLKAICEGRELPAYEAASEFIARTAGELDGLLSDLGGENNALNTLEKLEKGEEQAQRDLAGLLERMQRCKERDPQLEQSVVEAANRPGGGAVFTVRWWGGTWLILTPSNSTSPEVGDRNPPMIRSVVVLPHPLGPSSVRNSLSLIYRLMWSSTTSSP